LIDCRVGWLGADRRGETKAERRCHRRSRRTTQRTNVIGVVICNIVVVVVVVVDTRTRITQKTATTTTSRSDRQETGARSGGTRATRHSEIHGATRRHNNNNNNHRQHSNIDTNGYCGGDGDDSDERASVQRHRRGESHRPDNHRVARQSCQESTSSLGQFYLYQRSLHVCVCVYDAFIF
jgi:hypothetical protein